LNAEGGGEAPHDGKHNAAVTDEALLELQVAENDIFDIQKNTMRSALAAGK
jgi:hypothetical protein